MDKVEIAGTIKEFIRLVKEEQTSEIVKILKRINDEEDIDKLITAALEYNIIWGNYWGFNDVDALGGKAIEMIIMPLLLGRLPYFL